MTAANEASALLVPRISVDFGDGVVAASTETSKIGTKERRSFVFRNGATHPFLQSLSFRVTSFLDEHSGSIGTLGSVAIAVNSLTGPAMLDLPALFARSGIIPTCSTLIFVCLLSTFCSLQMANTISKVPGNLDFKQEVEFSEVFRIFWGRPWFIVSQVLFFCCVTCLNISSIVDTTQVVDTFLGHWMYGGTAALLVTSDAATWIRWDYSLCSQQDMLDGECIPFKGVQGILLTAGNLITALVFLPPALMDLKENAAWQILGFAILLVTSTQFIIQFATWPGLTFENSSWWGTKWDDLFGVVLFNFALVIAVPAWLYERESHVNVPAVIHGSSLMSIILYISVGLLGSMAMPNVAENMLESMMSGVFGTWMQLGASIFAFGIVGLGIPLFSVFVRLNLMSNNGCSRTVGNILAVYLPFAASWILNDGATITKLLSWGGVIFTSLVVFILPLLIAIHVTQEYDAVGSIDVFFGWFEEKSAHLTALRILLALAVLAIAAAFGGYILTGEVD